MCQKKPGPRCSTDSLKAFEKAQDALLAMRLEQLDSLPMDEEDAVDRVQALAALEKAARKARLIYRSTPRGNGELRSLVSLAGVGDVNIPIHINQFNVEKPVSVQNGALLLVTAEAATTHREWQVAMNKSLDLMQPMEALTFVGLSVSSIRDTVAQDKKALRKLIDEKNMWFSLDQESIVDHTRKLRGLEMKMQGMSNKIFYDEIKLEDLNDWRA